MSDPEGGETRLLPPDDKGRHTAASFKDQLFGKAQGMESALSSIRQILSDLRGWPEFSRQHKDRIEKITVAATVAPKEVQKALKRAAQARSAVMWMMILMMMFSVSLIGAVYRTANLMTALTGVIAMPIIAYAAIRSAKRATWMLLEFIAEDDPNNETEIYPHDFPVTPGVIFAPWIKNRQDIFKRIGRRLLRALKNYAGIRTP